MMMSGTFIKEKMGAYFKKGCGKSDSLYTVILRRGGDTTQKDLRRKWRGTSKRKEEVIYDTLLQGPRVSGPTPE